MKRLKSVKEVIKPIEPLLSWPSNQQGNESLRIVYQAVLGDRSDILEVLREGVKEIKEFMAVASSPEFEMGYKMAIKDYEERALKLLQETLGVK